VQTAYNILLFIAIVVAVVFGVLVLITGKGDAMSGGGSVRTTFKGKASFDDYMSRMTLILGASFFALMLLIDAVSNRIDLNKANQVSAPPVSTSAPTKH
jgi:protein translocase SecG subunit